MYYRIVSGKKIYRTWLSILIKDNNFNSIYCLICIAFGSGISNFSSSSNCTNLKSMYSAIERQEKSIIHTHYTNTVKIYFKISKEMSMEYLINRNMMTIKRQEKENNTHVLKDIFKIVKYLVVGR